MPEVASAPPAGEIWHAHFLAADPVMSRVILAAGPFGLVPKLERTPFESLARSIAHQQLSTVVAGKIVDRFIAHFGSNAFPSPEQVIAAADADLRAVGFSFAKIASLKDLAAKASAGVVPTTPELLTLDDQEIVERLTQVRGIGRWTVEMLLMFQLGRPDVLPIDDFGVRNGFRLAYGLKGLPTPRALAAYGERWAPHRSVAAWYLWRAVELARDGRLPPPGRAPRVKIARVKTARVKIVKTLARAKAKKAASALKRVARKIRKAVARRARK